MGLLQILLNIIRDSNLSNSYFISINLFKRMTVMSIVYGETQNLSYNEGTSTLGCSSAISRAAPRPYKKAAPRPYRYE